MRAKGRTARQYQELVVHRFRERLAIESVEERVNTTLKVIGETLLLKLFKWTVSIN